MLNGSTVMRVTLVAPPSCLTTKAQPLMVLEYLSTQYRHMVRLSTGVYRRVLFRSISLYPVGKGTNELL